MFIFIHHCSFGVYIVSSYLFEIYSLYSTLRIHLPIITHLTYDLYFNIVLGVKSDFVNSKLKGHVKNFELSKILKIIKTRS